MLTVNIVKYEDGIWAAVSPDYPGCHGDGDSPAEALRDLADAFDVSDVEYGTPTEPRDG